MAWGTFLTYLAQAAIGCVFLVILAAAAVAIVPDLRNIFGKKK